MKRLVINPTEAEQANLKMLSYGGIIRGLMQKVLQRNKENFSPVTVREYHVGLFVSNVEPKLVAANLYAGTNLPDFEAAQLHLNDLGKRIYDNKYWITKALSNEVFVDRDPNAQFGFKAPDPGLAEAIKKDLEDICTVELRLGQAPSEDQEQNTTQKEDK